LISAHDDRQDCYSLLRDVIDSRQDREGPLAQGADRARAVAFSTQGVPAFDSAIA